MRIFLDTNVLASAATTRGLCADALRHVLASHELLISPQILEELERVLETKFGVPASMVRDFFDLVRDGAVVVEAGDVPQVELQDRNDLPILSAALHGRADVLVTGDKELTGIARVENVRILSPREYWETLKTDS
jgi:putative PIN family toxin of toxin-antitoxin system